MLQCDAYTGSFQSKSEAFAEAFDAWLRALDDVGPVDEGIEVPIGAKRPTWGKAPPELPLAPAKGMTSVGRVDQRNVKAIGQLGARPRNIT